MVVAFVPQQELRSGMKLRLRFNLHSEQLNMYTLFLWSIYRIINKFIEVGK